VNVRRLALALLALAAGPARADKGHVWPSPVELAESSQKAILLHDGKEEVLILGVELRAAREAQVLEFIPFPSEPKVSLAEGDPFGQVQRLIREKRLEYEPGPPVKGGRGAPAAVELTFSARIGVHDVAVVQVNDAGGFEAWVRAFFREKGLPDSLDLGGVLPVAEDYLRRGLRWFVFDTVTVGTETRFAAPLAYRFRSEQLYYPLKDSNIVGGKGTVELVLILPGSFLHEGAPEALQRVLAALRRTSDTPHGWLPSSSAKVYPGEAEAVFPGAAAFFARTPKLYLQVLEFVGPYRFTDDLFLDLRDLRPYAWKFPPPEFGVASLDPFPGLSEDEIQDYCEANPGVLPCQGRPGKGQPAGKAKPARKPK
jgi:hypothetical protein